MDTKIKREEIIELIKKGFEDIIIAFEYDLPIEYVEECKREVDKEKKTLTVEQEKENMNAHKKMERIRDKYKKICSKNIMEQTKEKKAKVQTKEEQEKIEQNIEFIEQTVKEMQEMKDKNSQKKREKAKEVLRIIKEIQNIQMTIEQIDKLKELMEQDVFENLNKNREDKIDKAINIARINTQQKLSETIEDEANITDDIDKLKALSKKITYDMTKNNPLRVGSIKRRIDDKIYKLQQEEYRKNKEKTIIPSDIMQIVQNIAEGNLDCQKAIETIDEKAQRTVESKKQTKFTLTKEQEFKKIVRQIQQTLTNNAEKYAIKDSQKAIDSLIKLESDTPEIAIRTVVKNFAFRGEIEEAKQICKQKKRESKYYKSMKILQKEIENEEIKKQVLQYLSNDNISPEEEKDFLNILEEKVENEEIIMSEIKIGKSKDNLHTITLEEICSGIIFQNQK